MNVNPPRLLVSVRNAREAEAALRGGADVIDIKEPSRGPLGMADAQTIGRILEAVAGRAPVSAALGELSDAPPVELPESIAYVKVGLARAEPQWRPQLAATFRHYRTDRAIAVAYADYDRVDAPPLDEVLQWACEFGAAGLLVDTAVKDGRALFDAMEPAAVKETVDQAKERNLLVALAGSLQGPSIERAICLGADVIAVRGVACRGQDRCQTIDESAVRSLAQIIEAGRSTVVRPAS